MHFLKALLPLVLLACSAPCIAQTDIHRCIDASGRALFTDQPCSALQATAVKPAEKPVADPAPASGATVAPASLSAPTEPPPILCAATFGKLRQSVIDAFASRNANRMAGLMLWNGYGSETAVANIRALASLMRQPLLDAGPPSSGDTSTEGNLADGGQVPSTPDQDEDSQAGGGELVLHLAGNDGNGNPREVHYGVVRRYGCLWLRVGG